MQSCAIDIGNTQHDIDAGRTGAATRPKRKGCSCIAREALFSVKVALNRSLYTYAQRLELLSLSLNTTDPT